MTAPWNAHQWVNCNGSVPMQTLYPSTGESDSQREGKAIRFVIEELIKRRKDVEKTFKYDDLINCEAPNGVIVDEEMLDIALNYFYEIREYALERHSLHLINVEDDLDLSHLGPNMSNGRPDVYVYDENKNEILVSDFIYGHRIVDVFENHRLICYVSGILQKHNIDGADDQRVRVRMRVYQPRAPHPDGISREWVCIASDLRGYINNIKDASIMSHGSNAVCRVGTWCGDCSARLHCQTFTNNLYAGFQYINEPLPFELDNNGLSAEFQLLEQYEKLIKARKTAIEPVIIDKLRDGEQIIGLTSKQGYGRETWQTDKPLDEITLMADLLGVDINKPREIDTPAQVRKKGIDPEVIKMYSYKPKTKMKIVKDDGAKARQVFKG